MRRCEFKGCLRRFTPKRPHQRFCRESCRYEHWAAEHGEQPQTPAQRVEEPTRRRSRDGKGAHLYLTVGELDLIVSALRRLELPPTPATEKFREKLVRAIQRSQTKVGRAGRSSGAK